MVIRGCLLLPWQERLLQQIDSMFLRVQYSARVVWCGGGLAFCFDEQAKQSLDVRTLTSHV